MRALLVWIALLLAPAAMATESAATKTAPGDAGQVTVPLPVYTQMLNQLSKEPRSAPAAYAIGQASVTVRIAEIEDRFSAQVNVNIRIETFENEWILVPILPPGTVLRHATANGRPVQLVHGPEGLAWSTDKAGVVTMQLAYGVDAQRSESGFVLPLPVPVAAATTFGLTFPGVGADLAVVPSTELRRVERQGRTHYTASVPATSSILVTWRAPAERPYAIGRADYTGVLKEDAMVWTAHFRVEMFRDEVVTLPLMPSAVTLNEIRVDGEAATVLEEGGRFGVLLDGRGMHDVRVSFQVPVVDDAGPPQARLQIPRIPVSHFELELPGRKVVKASPGANVVTAETDDGTRASVFIPMSDAVTFSWTDAIPVNLRAPFRANASLYHVVHAEEGVLHGRATIVYEISHGETNQLTLEIPADTQVNRITAPGGGLSDWAVADSDEPGRKRINVFLEVAQKGEYVLEISYERLLGGGDPEAGFAVPLLSADKVNRQRGMVALLSGQELALKPVTETGVSRVGENQLPAFVRNQIAMTVAHTYKYTEPRPTLEVQTVAPERRQGKFDAQVDTLISLGDVTMKGSATVEIDVKSGTIMELILRLPADVNVLGVSGPSLRSQQVREAEDGAQTIALEFTREMEGRFRIEVAYERIMDGEASEPVVPTISVMEAEVEHGRIAVEALTAVEVSASRTDRLSNLDLNELPQQLVLKTTNPILMAYRYVHAKPPFTLALKITRHKEIDVQVAAIERAVYSSLFTRDGLAVTTARLDVRNSRRQFLRLGLPAGSKVWSVFVDGKPEKPAFAGDGEGRNGDAVLIKMINSAAGFPVDIVYATPMAPMATLGSLSSHLPRPDMVVTHSRWNVFLPTGPRYQTPDSSMDLVVGGRWANPRRAAQQGLDRASEAQRAQMGQPLRISVPTQGILFAFEKLYANQSPEAAAFSIRYASAGADQLALLASLAGTVLLWIGIVAIGGRRLRLSRNATVATLVLGIAVLVASIGYLGTTPIPASSLALAIALGLLVWWGIGRLNRWRQDRAVAAAEAPAEET